MSLYRRSNGIWYIDHTPRGGGPRIRQSTFTKDKRAAKELHDKVVAEAWRISKLGEKPRRTWQDAVKRWLRERASKASIKDDRQRLRWLHTYLGHLYLDEITRDVIDNVIQAKLDKGAGNGTVNRHLAVIRSILRAAMNEWDWLDKTPNIRLLVEPKGRERFLTREETDRLADALPEHLKEPYRFALATGLRQRNVLDLLWNQVDLDRAVVWIHARQAKARKAIGVPLNDEAVAVLRRQRGKHKELCFTRDGQPIKRIDSKTWSRALKRADLGSDVCWHVASRHTWASWHAMAGTPLLVLKELGAWSSLEMVNRYAHLAPDHLREYANSVTRSAVRGTVAAQ
ncbi:MAG: site-specific integrase [Acidiferrobacterales bacterium]